MLIECLYISSIVSGFFFPRLVDELSCTCVTSHSRSTCSCTTVLHDKRRITNCCAMDGSDWNTAWHTHGSAYRLSNVAFGNVSKNSKASIPDSILSCVPLLRYTVLQRRYSSLLLARRRKKTRVRLVHAFAELILTRCLIASTYYMEIQVELY